MNSFAGRTNDFESTVMPSVRSWLREAALEDGGTAENHTMVIFCNCPAMGILSAGKINYILSFVTNVLADFPTNGICLLVKPNRASSGSESRIGGKKYEMHGQYQI